ncbi:MAG: signal recognition particle-docking protein FtsY [Scytonema sp. PMC 1069.18]|nr:signal recognition particle-docking protein FtsY [Scytonema sp. PMC 1069.18]MEC4887161.1 signal recognition particle-docking protein FtsY [Scytonema sp. PMC 1070.18]
MVFNWFRRQHNEPSSTPSQETQAETAAAKETQPEPAATSTAETAPDVSQDLLAYAKAAYKNIQHKQQPTQEEETPASEAVAEAPPEKLSEEPEIVPAETQTPESLKVEETPPPPEQSVIAESATTAEEPDGQDELSIAPAVEDTTASEPDAESFTTPESATPPPASTEVTSPEPLVTDEVAQPAAPATLSFLERAAAERQARQEKLIANAIEVTEPAVKPSQAGPTTTTTETEEIPGLAFDEGFVWSAEVLAAQGRRPEDISIEEITWLKKLRQGLDKTRRNILNQLKAIVGQGPLNQAGVTEIEALLLQADVGVEATDHIINTLQNKLRQEALPPEEAIAYLKQILRDMLEAPVQKSGKVSFAPDKETLNIWLMTGVNGVGKTTTIGKIAHLANNSGYKCLIGAADTFRAAAVEQVKIWGQRSGVDVIANPAKNADPAAVVFDAIAAAQARNTELLLVDTAGRLQNKKNLMDELSKVRRIIDKKAPNAKVESLLVLDATLGQNGLRQAEVFSQAAQLSGVVLTKLDGTAKGGVALAVVQQLGLPIRFIGAGEGIEDLRPFSSYEFIEALLSG